MKIMTVLGTRPEIIRLSRVIEKLDKLCDHVLVHTGQNFDPNLSDIFFKELKVRKPNHYLGVKGETFGRQIGQMLEKVDTVMAKEKPDRLLILGDTNSGLSAILAKRRGIPVFHMEAGNRCYDDRVPEEVNRRVIDHSSDILMPYTERSRQNLLKEGIEGQRIFVTGNPILEVINHYEPEITKSQIHKKLGLKKKKYFLVTLHRAENVDLKPRLKSLLAALDRVQKQYKLPLILSLHPHTRQKIAQFVIKFSNPDIRSIDPPGFFSFISLERNAFCVLSDSGTVQEECCIFKVPNVTLRDVTERPETIECGSNILSGSVPEAVLKCVKTVLANPPNWNPPSEYLVLDVADTVCKIVFGFNNSK
ncbi:MAG: UDP-N-acetylglucosamine 2-epimerase (non-hydrolyzing) [Candidatus Aminicenantes bacterium]|nr:UDP-N-acetylglucosamine 2-epimerase (non-hydrolyzing) [Acidobacteriota bacterium]MCG2812702.1 UDP-N-acetylglucosamine 2-epimerase (non-hydrolyzing) [Candidatus Aminicenantes bacterium]